MKRLISILICVFMAVCLCPVQAKEHVPDNITAVFSYIGYHDLNDINNDVYSDQGKITAHETVWKKETAYFKVAVTSTVDTTVSASADALKAPNGLTIPDVSIHYLKKAYASTGTEGNVSSAPHLWIPEIITNKTETQIKAGETEYFWIEVKVPENAEDWIYSGKIIFHYGNGKTDQLRIYLNVMDEIIPEGNLSLDLWQYPYSSYYYYDCFKNERPFSAKHLSALRKELEIYKEAGGDAITAVISDEPWQHQTYYDTPSLVKWIRNSDGSLSFDYQDFDAYVSLCMELGIDRRIDAFSILPFDNSIQIHETDGTVSKIYLSPGSEEWIWYWHTMLTDFASHLEEKGWFDKTYIFVDERQIGYFQTALALLDTITDSQGYHFHTASSINQIPRDTDLYDQIDYLSISIASLPENDAELDVFINHRNSSGLETTMYNCSTNYPNSFAISDPVESLWSMQYLVKRNMNGYLRWALDAWNDSPLQSLDYWRFEAGDILLLYPDEKESSNPVPNRTVRFCMMQKGMNDIRKYEYLMEQLNDNEAKKLLEDGFYSLKRTYGIYNAYGAMVGKNDVWKRQNAIETMRMEKLLKDACQIHSVFPTGILHDQILAKMRILVQE